MSDWCTIESDPGVFTALINEIGVRGVSVEELYDIDQPLLERVYGLIFLFKYIPEKKECLLTYDHELFFANQVITNACATQALLNILLNQEDLELGEELTNFKQFTKDMDSKTRGLVISNSEVIKTAHNSFKKVEPFIFENQRSGGKQEDVFHFVAYLCHHQKVYELDGLQPAPVLIASLENNQDWLGVAKQEIQLRIQKYCQSEIRFNLMAVIANRKIQAEKSIKQLNQEKINIYQILQNQNYTMQEFQDDQQKLQQLIPLQNYNQQLNINQCLQRLNLIRQEIQVQQDIFTEQVQREHQQKQENIRRKHDYTPFIIELLKQCTEKGHLEDIIKKAQR